VPDIISMEDLDKERGKIKSMADLDAERTKVKSMAELDTERGVTKEPGRAERFLTGLMGTITDPFVKEQEARNLALKESLKVTPTKETFQKFITPGAPEVQTQLGKQAQQFSQAIATPAGKVGQVAGEIGKFAIPYGAGGKTVEKLVSPVSKRIGQAVTGKLGEKAGKAAGTLATEFAKDVIIGQPINYVQARERGLEGKELAKFMGEQSVIDLVANTAFYGLGKGIQALRKTTPEVIEKAAKEVAEQTTLPKEVVADVIDKQIPEATKPITPEISPKIEPKVVSPSEQLIKDKKILYHGSMEEFDKFDFNRIGEGSGNEGFYGKGFYLTEIEETAELYGDKILKFESKLENPYEINKDVDLNEISKVMGVDIPATNQPSVWKVEEMVKTDPEKFKNYILDNG